MSKHNILAKKIKKQFISINNTIESYFNNLRYFLINFRKTKFFGNNKVFLAIGGLVILFLTYLLLPTLYNESLIQTEIKNQIFKKYNVKIKFNNTINYGLLPKPHFHSKDLSILRNEREIGKASNVKIFIAANNFFKFNKINSKNLIFKKTDFNIYQEDLSFFKDLLKIEPNENRIIFKDSNIFFKNKDDEVLFINKTKKSEFYYDSNNLENILSSKNEIFNIPFKFTIKNDKFNKKVYSIFDSNKIRLNIKNIISYDDIDLIGVLDILFINKDTSLVYKIKKNSLSFNSENNDNYDGIIEFKPFYFLANFNYDGISTKNLLNNDSIIIDIIQSKIINNKNFNSNVQLNIKNITNIDELNNLNLNFGINQGKIVFSDSNIMWKDSAKITLNESLLNYNENEINLVGKIVIDFKDTNNFYQTFQIKKNIRKKIEQIQIDFIYDFNKKEISFDNVKVDKKTNIKLQNFLDQFNSSDNKVFNKITFKNFVNNFFSVYAG